MPGCHTDTQAPERSCSGPGRSGLAPQPPGRRPASALLALPFAGCWESTARRPLAVPSAPAAAATSHQREPGPLCPAPGLQTTPPGARTRLSTLALYLQIQAGPVGFRCPTTVLPESPLLLMPQARTSQIAKTVPPSPTKESVGIEICTLAANCGPCITCELGRKEIVGPHLSATES